MWKYNIEVKGMMCGMCEAHMNEAIRKEFDVKKVKSSHTKNNVEIVSENELDQDLLVSVIAATGYERGAVKKEEYKKKGFFGLF